jgi:glycosyltransferase involved in cell wall biosynthesis
MPSARITFVIPAYQSADTIERTIKAALAEGNGCPILVVFDGPDPEAERRVPRVPNVEVIVRPINGGACAARNLGLEKCTTDYVIFLDADDQLEGGLIANAVGTGDRQNADIILSDFVRLYPNGTKSGFQHPGRTTQPDLLFGEWMRGNFVSPCAIVWRTSFVRRIGGWNEKLAQNQDGEIMYRALAARPNVAWNEKGHGVYFEHNDPTRVSVVMKDRQIQSQFAALEVARELNEQHKLVDPSDVGIAYYRLARRLYGRGAIESGDRALGHARALGFRGHFGSGSHRVFASLVGLKWKVMLTNNLRGIQRLFSGHGRSLRARQS